MAYSKSESSNKGIGTPRKQNGVGAGMETLRVNNAHGGCALFLRPHSRNGEAHKKHNSFLTT